MKNNFYYLIKFSFILYFLLISCKQKEAENYVCVQLSNETNFFTQYNLETDELFSSENYDFNLILRKNPNNIKSGIGLSILNDDSNTVGLLGYRNHDSAIYFSTYMPYENRWFGILYNDKLQSYKVSFGQGGEPSIYTSKEQYLGRTIIRDESQVFKVIIDRLSYRKGDIVNYGLLANAISDAGNQVSLYLENRMGEKVVIWDNRIIHDEYTSEKVELLNFGKHYLVTIIDRLLFDSRNDRMYFVSRDTITSEIMVK